MPCRFPVGVHIQGRPSNVYTDCRMPLSGLQGRNGVVLYRRGCKRSCNKCMKTMCLITIPKKQPFSKQNAASSPLLHRSDHKQYNCFETDKLHKPCSFYLGLKIIEVLCMARKVEGSAFLNFGWNFEFVLIGKVY